MNEQHSGILGLNPTINQKENPYVVGNDLWQLQGWGLNESLSIQKRQGFQKINSTQLTENLVPAAFTGLFEYAPSSGATPTKLATGLTGVYIFNTGTFGWDAPTIPAPRTGVHHDLYASRMLFDQLYLGGGGSADVNLRYNGTTSIFYQMGITAPASAPVGGAPSAGGNLGAGVYSWKVTFTNDLNQESLPSPVSNSVTIVGGSGNYTVQLTGLPISSDPQVKGRKLYRTTANGAVWLLVAVSNDNVTTTYTDGNSDAQLGIAVDAFNFGVPPHFSMIEIYKGYAFMGGDPNNKSRVWFSNNGAPAYVNSNDFRDLDPNDGDTLKGLLQFQSTVAAFKGYSIWVLSGQDRNSFAFSKQVTHVGSVNNASLVEIPMVSVAGTGGPAEGKIAFLSPTARFYFFDGTTAVQTAIGLEPILNSLDKSKLDSVVGTLVPAQNQVRWMVPSNSIPGYHANDLIIWYDYVLDKWGTISAGIPMHFSALMHDSSGNLQYYVGGVPPIGAGANISGGWVYQGDTGGADDTTPISVEVIDKGHPRYLLNPLGQAMMYPTPENLKVFSRLFVWYKTLPQPVALNVWGIIDDPTNTPILLGTITCTHPSGQETLKFNLQGRRLFIRITESSTVQGLLIRGWKVWFKDVHRGSAI